MKKFKTLIIPLIVTIGLLAGCSQSTKSNNVSNLESNISEASEDTSNTETTNESSTRIYTDLAGREVEIPVNPQKIVTINMTAEAIALGLTPIGAADNWLTNLEDSQKEGIESIGAVGNLSMETILELEPELIITPINITDETTIEALSKIAPTVVGPFFGDGIENLRTIGDILGRSTEAETWIASYEAKAKETKDKLSDVIVEGKTAMVVQLDSAKTIYIYPSSTWPTIHSILGLSLPDVTELEELTSGQELSLEKLAEYNPDYIFLTSTSDNSSASYKQEILDSPVWQSLNASKNNQVYSLGSRLSAGDVLTLDWALDEVVRAVEEVK